MAANQPFLARLGLDTSADERAIRRAYAQLLKGIDPAKDPRGFQSLRESYEAALAWAKRTRPPARRPALAATAAQEVRDGSLSSGPAGEPPPRPAPWGPRAQAPDEADPTPAPAPELVQIPPEEASNPVQPLALAAPPHRKVSAPKPSVKIPELPTSPPPPQALANGVFSVLLARSNAWSSGWIPRSEGRAQAELGACLRDPRLLNLVARRLFEQRVVDHLAQGSGTGRKALLTASTHTFGWIQDRRRLEQFGPSGRKLNQEIDSTSLIALDGGVGFRASLLRQWRFYRARRKRVRVRWSNKKRIWLIAGIYALFLLLKIFFE